MAKLSAKDETIIGAQNVTHFMTIQIHLSNMMTKRSAH